MSTRDGWRARYQRLPRWLRLVLAPFLYLVSGLSAFLTAVSTMTATLVFLPGILCLIGARALVANLCGVSVRDEEFMTILGSRTRIRGHATRWRRVAVLLGPYGACLLLGALLLTPYLVRVQVLGVPLLPVVGSNPRAVAGKEGEGVLFANLLFTYDGWDIARIWTGVACWFCCAPPYETMKEVRTTLRLIAHSHTKRRWVAAALARVSTPLVAATRVFSVFDAALVWLGGNAFIASGAISFIALLAAEHFALLKWLT